MVMDDVRPQRIERLTPLADVLTHLDALLTPIAAIELNACDAVGRVLAADVRAGPHPPVALALRDGFAVRSEETGDAGSYAPAPLTLATRVEVGMPLPAGADAVAPLDAVDDRVSPAQALAPVAPGEGVLAQGQDADPVEPLLRAGAPFRHLDLVALAALGVVRVSVRQPTVRVVTVKQDQVAQAIASMLTRAIVSSANVQVSEDLPDATRRPHPDLIIVIGGSGAGAHDDSVHAIARAGKVIVHGVGLSPGETTAFGLVGAVPVLVVPGRLDSALAAWHVIGTRILRRLCGRTDVPLAHDARLARKIASTVGLAEFVPVRAEGDAVTPLASGYLPWRALVRATGYVLVPAQSEGFSAGAIVPVAPL
jgi:molybdopterin biosynthesis enzyme